MAHFPSVDTGVHAPNFPPQPRRPPQNAGVLPQVPEEPQQLPNVLPRHVAFLEDAAPHLPSVEIGRAVLDGVADVVDDRKTDNVGGVPMLVDENGRTQ